MTNPKFPPYAKVKAVHKFGVNSVASATTAAQDVWSSGDVYTWPTESTICYVISDVGPDQSSATAGGGTSGAHAVVIEGLDANYHFQRETVSTDGTVTAETSLSFLRVYRSYVSLAGSLGSNKGKLGIYQQQAGGDIKVAEIPSETGQTLMSIYTVPDLSGQDRAYLYGIQANYAGGATGNTVLQLQMRGVGGAWQTKEEFALGALGSQSSHTVTYPDPLPIAPKTDIRMRVKGGTTSTAAAIAATFDIVYSVEDSPNA